MKTVNTFVFVKAWVKAHARGGALALLPLALAMNVQASTVALPTGNLNCTVTNQASCTDDTGSSTYESTGVSYYFGGETHAVAVTGNQTLTITTSETLGTLLASGTVVDYSYDFSLEAFADPPPPTPGYSFAIELLEGDTVIGTSGAITGTYAYDSETVVNGSGSFDTTASDTAGNNLTAEFVLTLSNVDGILNTVTIPEGSTIDIGPLTSSTTPEPATFGLIGAGLALTGLWRRVRR